MSDKAVSEEERLKTEEDFSKEDDDSFHNGYDFSTLDLEEFEINTKACKENLKRIDMKIEVLSTELFDK